MTLRHAFVLSLLLTVLLTACSDLVPTGTDRADQATSAQQFIPDLDGYARSNATNVTDAIAALGGSASLLSGNPALLVAIETIEGLIECYEEVGAVAAGIYTPPVLESLLAGQGLSVGAAAVINQERLSRNFLACALPDLGPSAQLDSSQPCGGHGSFVVANERIHYLYAATDPLLCFAFQNHFGAL